MTNAEVSANTSIETIQFGEDVPNNILYPVPHRQFVFSIPIMLRIYFKYDRKLLTQLCHYAKESLEMFFRTVLGLDDGILGMIMVIHTLAAAGAIQNLAGAHQEGCGRRVSEKWTLSVVPNAAMR